MTSQKLVRQGTIIAIMVALIGFVGIGFDKSWGSPVSMIAGAAVMVGVILMVIGVPRVGHSSTGRT